MNHENKSVYANLVSENVIVCSILYIGEHTKIKVRTKIIRGKYLFTKMNHENKLSVYAKKSNLFSKYVICSAVQSAPLNFSIYFHIAVLV